MLPPGLGFAGFWLLFQSLLGVYRIGGFGLQLLIAFAVLLAGMSLGLRRLRRCGLPVSSFLGRPRTPRTAVAEEVPQQLRLCLIGLAALSGLLAVLPGLAIVPAAPGLAQLANGSALGMQLVLKPAAGASGYAPIPIALLLAVAGSTTLWLLAAARFSPSARTRLVRRIFASTALAAVRGSGDADWRRFLRGADTPDTRTLSCAAWRHGPVRTSFVRLQADLRSAAGMASRPGVRGSVAATLAVLVLAVAVWLAAS